MDALILAGGMGTRLRSVFGELPKVMAPVGGKPFLAHLLEQLKEQGFQHMCLAVGYQSQVIKDYFQDGTELGVYLTYSEEKHPLGTGGGIKKASKLLSEEFLVLNGDSYLEIDLGKLKEFHTVKRALITIALVKSPDPERYAVKWPDCPNSNHEESFTGIGAERPGSLSGDTGAPDRSESE